MHSSVQLKMVTNQKAIRVPPCLAEVSPTLPLKRFICKNIFVYPCIDKTHGVCYVTFVRQQGLPDQNGNLMVFIALSTSTQLV